MRNHLNMCIIIYLLCTVIYTSCAVSARKITGCDPNSALSNKGANTTEVIKQMYEYLNQINSSKNKPSTSNSNSNSESKSIPDKTNFCQKYSVDFSSSTDLSMFNIEYCPQNVKPVNGLLQLDLTSECGTTLVYNKAFVKGKVEVVMKPAPGSGTVTALVLSGPPPSDEIDIEFVGITTDSVQSMYFVKGQRIEPLAQFHSTFPKTDLTSTFNSYAFEITDNSVNWYLNGDLVRTLTKKSADTFPGYTDNFRFGVWDGSNFPNFAGTIDFKSGTKSAFIKSITISPVC